MNTPSHPSINSLMQRAVSLCMAAMVTLSMLGGINQLAQQPTAADNWAAHTATAQRG